MAAISRTIAASAGALLLAIGWPVQPGRAASLDTGVIQVPCALSVTKAWPSDIPTVYVVGQPDRSTKPVRLTKGLCLNGMRLTERLLSESVLILYPDETGKWGYYPGFDIFRGPQRVGGKQVDPRTLVEYDKWQYDPLEPAAVASPADMNVLLLHVRPMVYEIAFPDPIRIRRFTLSSNCDQLNVAGIELLVTLYADAARQDALAHKRLVSPQDRFPVVFDNLDAPRLVLEVKVVKNETQLQPALYYTKMEAELAAPGLKLPRLERGTNTLQVTDDPDSSHRARIVLSWLEKPEPDRVWDDFEKDFGWGEGGEQVESTPANGLAFTGERFARIRFPATGGDRQMVRYFSPPLDLTRYNRMGIASRARRGIPVTAYLFGIRNEGGGNQYLRPYPGRTWTWQTFDMSALARDKVVSMCYYFVGNPEFNHPEITAEYDVDTLCFYSEKAEASAPAAPAAPWAGYRSPSALTPPVPRPIPPIRNWFPMGFYDGFLARPEAEMAYVLDRMKRLNMNAIYINNAPCSFEPLDKALGLGEARGIRMIFQTGDQGAMLFPPGTEAERSKWITRFKNRWGLLAWSLTEEIGPETARQVLPAHYRLVRELDTNHPPTVIHNNLQAAQADLQTNRPAVITHDFYPFFWSPMDGPSNPGRSVPTYLGHVESYYRACRGANAILWMMPQAWGTDESAPLDPPGYGYRTGMRTPEPGEIKLQGWTAVARGAKGIMFYAGAGAGPGDYQLWDYGWQETANTRAAGELFAALTRVAPLLCRIDRDDKEDGFVKVTNGNAIAHSFVKQPGHAGNARYVVLAGTDGFSAQEVGLALNAQGPVFDMVGRREIQGPFDRLALGAGEGTVLLVGSQDEFEADCRMIDAELEAVYGISPPSGRSKPVGR